MNAYSKYTAALALAALALTACEKDGDTIYIGSVTDPSVETTATDIVLDENNLEMLALTVFWNENGDITLSDPCVAAPSNAFTNTLQISASEDFSTVYEETMGAGVTSRQFTAGELNSAAIRGGMESGTTAPVYIRIKSVLGPNVAPRYSNVLTVNLTTYLIDLTIGAILDKNQEDTGRTLALTDRENVFAGFLGAASWENWYFRAPGGELWGTAADPGEAFMLGSSSKGEIWNNWFPEPAGCYYTTVNIPANEWTAQLVKSLSLSGDISGEMTYDRHSNAWSYTFDAEARSYSVSISGLSDIYNHSGGDGAPAQTDVPVGFGGQAGALTFGSSASAVTFDVATAGEVSIVLDLSDPKAWTIGTGSLAPVVEAAPMVYLLGIIEPWGFSDYLRLYNEEELSYGGVHYVESLWGWQVGTEVDNWSDVYKMVAGGNASEGKLAMDAQDNITAPENGTYIFDISLKWLTYKLTALTSVSATGMNDDWNLHAMTATETPGVYTCEFEKTAETPWGVKIIFNEDWDLFYGGNGNPGEMCYKRDGFTGDNDFAVGDTVVLTVDLFNATYSYAKK